MKNQPQISPHDQVSPYEILTLLGLGRLSAALKSPMDVACLLERGLPKKSIGRLVNGTGITLNEMSVVMHVTHRTLKSWQAHTERNQLLAPLQSSQLWLLAVVIKQAQYVLGEERLALTWLRDRHIGLSRQRPLDLLSTPVGANVLLNFLNQIDRCVYV